MDQMKKMHCPRCSFVFSKTHMRKVDHPSGAVLDVCDRCGGMWLDKDDVAMLYNYSNKASVGKNRQSNSKKSKAQTNKKVKKK